MVASYEGGNISQGRFNNMWFHCYDNDVAVFHHVLVVGSVPNIVVLEYTKERIMLQCQHYEVKLGKNFTH